MGKVKYSILKMTLRIKARNFDHQEPASRANDQPFSEELPEAVDAFFFD